jgi:hypothetical protein
MALRLMPRSPRRRIRLVTVAAGLMATRSGWIDIATGSLIPATGARTTRFCRTLWRRSSCAPLLAHGKPPCEHTRADAIASTASPPTFVTTRDAPLAGKGWGELVALICPTAKAESARRVVLSQPGRSRMGKGALRRRGHLPAEHQSADPKIAIVGRIGAQRVRATRGPMGVIRRSE